MCVWETLTTRTPTNKGIIPSCMHDRCVGSWDVGRSATSPIDWCSLVQHLARSNEPSHHHQHLGQRPTTCVCSLSTIQHPREGRREKGRRKASSRAITTLIYGPTFNNVFFKSKVPICEIDSSVFCIVVSSASQSDHTNCTNISINSIKNLDGNWVYCGWCCVLVHSSIPRT